MAKMEIQLTDREADLMRILWQLGPSLVSEVQAALTDRLAYNTVLTILRNLQEKRYVGHLTEGRGHRYYATIREQAAQHGALAHLTRKLFHGSAELLLIRLSESLTPAQIDWLRSQLEMRGRGDPGDKTA